jgi:hypothetical protein
MIGSAERKRRSPGLITVPLSSSPSVSSRGPIAAQELPAMLFQKAFPLSTISLRLAMQSASFLQPRALSLSW